MHTQRSGHFERYYKKLLWQNSNPFVATRYHSLIVKEDTLPAFLEVTARADDDEIMGIRHKEYPLEGVQFHPASFLTEEGPKLLENFLALKLLNNKHPPQAPPTKGKEKSLSPSGRGKVRGAC